MTVASVSVSGSSPALSASATGSESWCQLCSQLAQRTFRPAGGIAPSFTTYCVPQFGQVRIIATKALFRDGERTVNRNAYGLARQRLAGRFEPTGRLVAAVAEFDSVGLRYGTGAEV